MSAPVEPPRSPQAGQEEPTTFSSCSPGAFVVGADEDPPTYRSADHASQGDDNQGAYDAFVVATNAELAGPKTARAEPIEEEPACFSKRCFVILMIFSAVAVAALVAVLVPLVLLDGGGGSSPSLTEPIGGENPQEEDCFQTTREVADAQRTRSDLSFVEYTLCSGTTYQVDDTVNRNQPFEGANPPLLAQSNMHVKCGADGSLSNACVVSEGEILVMNSYSTAAEYGAFNVTFEGVTFENGWPTLMQMTNGGDIVFRNCLFRQDVSIPSPQNGSSMRAALPFLTRSCNTLAWRVYGHFHSH